MKKFIGILAVLAVAVAFTTPAMADVKFTSKGYMDVTGILAKKNIIDVDATTKADSTNAWYQMEMIIDPTLAINDKVKIHARITVLERHMSGAYTNSNNLGTNGANYRSEPAGGNEFWVERLWMAFPLFGGELRVGRMSGGSWAYPFQDNDDNRDRILWIGRLGGSPFTLVGVIEKLGEGDGGSYLTTSPAGSSWTNSASDTDAYALGAILPFSKNIIYRPLIYFINSQQTDTKTYLFLNGLMLNFGVFKLDAEINYRWGTTTVPSPGQDIDYAQFTGWVEGTFMLGPAELGVGIFYLQGEDENATVSNPERNSLWGTGQEFEPSLLLFSEDIGLLFNTSGVSNASIGTSGYEAAYVKAGFKLSDTMKVRAIFVYLNANEMLAGSAADGVGTADDHIGMELDVGFEWQFMPNIKYVFEAGYLKAGDYFKDRYGATVAEDITNDPYGCRHMLVITW